MLNTEQSLRAGHRGRAWIRLAAQLAVVAVLLCLAALNIAGRAAWSEMEDGVLWAASTGDLTAREIAPGSPAERAGLRAGDVLMAIDRKPVDSIDDVVAALHTATDGQALSYTVLRMQSQELISVAVAPIPSGPLGLYYVLAAVGIFALLVGASVRLRRPENQATLHFFWLSIAFFGVLAFSFSGRLDALDLVFYWGDVVAMLLLPPLFVHFALVFPERPGSWARSEAGRTLLPILYLPALLLFGAVARYSAAWVMGRTPSGIPTNLNASSAETATASACGSALPTSSAAKITIRRNTNRGSSPASSMRAIQ